MGDAGGFRVIRGRFNALPRALLRSRRSSGFSDGIAPAGRHQIGEGEQCEQLRSVPGHTAIARLAMTEQVFDEMERMLNFRPDAGFQMFQLFLHASQFTATQGLAFGALHGDMPRHRFPDVLGPILHALITGVTECCCPASVQQCDWVTLETLPPVPMIVCTKPESKQWIMRSPYAGGSGMNIAFSPYCEAMLPS